MQPSGKSRKPLDIKFARRPPPRPSPRKPSGSSSALRVHLDRDETVGATRRQIFSTNPTSHDRDPDASLSSPSSNLRFSSSNNVRDSNLQETDSSPDRLGQPHPAKKRRGTPKKQPSVQGKENADSLHFNVCRSSEGEVIPIYSSSTAKSLFTPETHEAQERKLEASSLHLRAVDTKIDPWEIAGNLSTEKQRSHYWNLCYGQQNDRRQLSSAGSWSATRAKPAKSW